MATTADEKLAELLKDFDTAMLVTRTAEGRMRARPMALAEVEEDGTLWFLTDRHTTKVDEVEKNGHVGVTMQSSRKFVSVSGAAEPVEDRQRVARLWREPWRVWFPGGQDDPGLVLLRVRCEAGEYWDNSGPGGIKYLLEAGKAYITGSRPDVGGDPKLHGKVGA